MHSQEITPEESEIRFVLMQIDNPLGHIQDNPWIATAKTIPAVVLILGTGERVVKMEKPLDKSTCYSHQRQEDNKWMPIASLISLEQVKALFLHN
jgi:hypothetical protein